MHENKQLPILLANLHTNLNNEMSSILRELGWEMLYEACSLNDALQTLSSNNISLLILMCGNDEKANISFLSDLRSKYKNLAVIVVSLASRPEQVLAAATLNVSGYLMWPVAHEILGSKIDEIFNDEVK